MHFSLLARFIAHVRHPGVVALQNVGNSSHWLCVDGGITRAGDGSRCCEFYVKEIRKKMDGYVVIVICDLINVSD